MGKFVGAATALLGVCAGCVIIGRDSGYAELSESPVMRRVQGVLPKSAERAVTSPAGVPSVQGVGGGGRSGGHTGGWSSDQRFDYTFRLVKGPPDWHQDRDKSWALPATEYPRVIRSVYTDVCIAVEEAGGELTERQCDGFTFLVRYRVSAPGDRVVAGTLRGRVGPEDTHNHTPPLEEPYYTRIAVDLREEAGRGD